jgi:hypothetical protein
MDLYKTRLRKPVPVFLFGVRLPCLGVIDKIQVEPYCLGRAVLRFKDQDEPRVEFAIRGMES